MQTKKMSLANIQGKLSRAEMKNIMAGSTLCYACTGDASCSPGHICRNSPSCIEKYVCALPYYV